MSLTLLTPANPCKTSQSYSCRTNHRAYGISSLKMKSEASTPINLALAIVCTATLFSTSDRALADESPGFRITFPDDIPIKDVAITAGLSGSFGLFVGPPDEPANPHEYILRTTSPGVGAEALRAIIYCPGYKILKVERSRPDPLDGHMLAKMEKLPMVRLSGELHFEKEIPRSDLILSVRYSAWWAMDFFHMIDGGIGMFTVATVPVRRDGSFSVDIPDFSKDPVSMAGPSKADIGFFVYGKTGGFSGDVVPTVGATEYGNLRIQPFYPKDLVLNVTAWKK